MATNLDQTIRKKLTLYLRGRMSLQAFSRWFFPATWDIEPGASASLTDLVYEITLRLAEFSQGHWSEEELQRQLQPLATRVPAELPPAKPASQPVSRAKTRRMVQRR